jgi:hypothetical protein
MPGLILAASVTSLEAEAVVRQRRGQLPQWVGSAAVEEEMEPQQPERPIPEVEVAADRQLEVRAGLG